MGFLDKIFGFRKKKLDKQGQSLVEIEAKTVSRNENCDRLLDYDA